MQNEIWADAEMFKLFCWCVMRAAFESKSVPWRSGKTRSMIEIERGQFIFGRRSAAAELNMKPETVRDRMKRLEKIGCIVMKTATQPTIVTVVKYDDYNPRRSRTRHPKPEAPRHPSATHFTNKYVDEQGGSNGQPAKHPPQIKNVKETSKNMVHGAMDLLEISKEEIADTAGRIFDKLKYDGDDGGNLWKFAALLHLELITENELWSAVRGGELNGRNRLGYTFTCLKESLANDGRDLKELMRRVHITPEWPRSPPTRTQPQESRDIIAAVAESTRIGNGRVA